MGLKGYRLWVMGQLDSTCSAPPWCTRSAPSSLTVAQMAESVGWNATV
jgi:hypothetical protein